MGLLELPDLRHTLVGIMGYLAEPYTRLPDGQKEWIMQLCQVLFHTKYQAK